MLEDNLLLRDPENWTSLDLEVYSGANNYVAKTARRGLFTGSSIGFLVGLGLQWGFDLPFGYDYLAVSLSSLVGGGIGLKKGLDYGERVMHSWFPEYRDLL